MLRRITSRSFSLVHTQKNSRIDKMAFAPESPLTLDGLPKFLSVVYHRYHFYGIYTFAELGVADRLVEAIPDRGLTAQEIIDDNHPEWNSALLHRILRACVDAGIVEQINNGIDDKHFVLTQSGMMLTSNHPSHIRDLIRWCCGPVHNGASGQLPALVRGEGTGSGIARISGGLDLYTFLCQPNNQDTLKIFTGAMMAMSHYNNPKLVTSVDYGRFSTLVDLGGNRGVFLAQILQHYPAIQHGIVFDLPHVVDKFKNGEEFESLNISKNRYAFVAGDMLDSSTIPQADAYVLKYMLHNYSDENVVAILSSIRKANQDQSGLPLTIFIAEHVIFPDGAVSNWQSHGADIAMAYMFENGCERTVQEYQQLLEQAGFEFKQLYPLQTPKSIIEAVLVK
jgi:hypothetical protein